MIYMAKTQRVSHGFLTDYFTLQSHRNHVKIDGEKNSADLFTKMLGNPRHCELRLLSGFYTKRQREQRHVANSARWQHAYHRHTCRRCATVYLHKHHLLGAHAHPCCLIAPPATMTATKSSIAGPADQPRN